MSKNSFLKLSPWPFDENEKVELFWLCSPYRDSENNRILTAVFKKSNNSLKLVEYPWGTLPYLRLGKYYSNGYPLHEQERGSIININIPDLSSGEICESFNMPSNLYYLKRNQESGVQKLWKFNVERKTYFLPCLELIRSLLAPNKILANQLIKPNGLDFLIISSKDEGENLWIELSKEIPNRLAIQDSTVLHLVWLKYDPIARRSWDGVYNRLFQMAVNQFPYNPVAGLSNYFPLEAIPPVKGKCSIKARCIIRGRNVLILELIGIDGLDLPFRNIYYSHPSIYEYEGTGEPRRKINIIADIEENENYELDDSGGSARVDLQQPLVKVPSTMLSFKKKPRVKKEKKRIEKVHNNFLDKGEVKETQTWLKEKELIVSTTESVHGGKIKPVDFDSIEVIENSVPKGLEDFVKAINLIKGKYSSLDISYSAAMIPDGKKISISYDGERRACGITVIKNYQGKQCCILEVARPDKWPISTLIIWPKQSYQTPDKMEEIIKKLLEQLVKDNGHWKGVSLNKKQDIFQYDKLKHVTNQRPSRWAERIFNKIVY